MKRLEHWFAGRECRGVAIVDAGFDNKERPQRWFRLCHLRPRIDAGIRHGQEPSNEPHPVEIRNWIGYRERTPSMCRRHFRLYDTLYACKALKRQGLTDSLVWHDACLSYTGENDMLKISIFEGETKRRLVLEGKLVAPWTDELKSVCLCPLKNPDDRELVVDVRGLTVISKDGEDVLLALMVHGAKFRGSDAFTKQVLKQLARQAHRNVQTTKA